MNIADKDKKTAILCITEKGAELAVKLCGLISSSTVFAPSRLQALYENAGQESISFYSQWKDSFAEVFNRYDRIVCVMATGIAVRSLAGLISSKFSDPAVVVVDEKGRFAISLISGHVGGANRLAEEVAACINGQAVITTATDVHCKPAVDLLAAQMEAFLQPLDRVRLINRLLAEGETVNLYSPFPLIESIRTGFGRREWPGLTMNFREPAVIISPQKIRLDSLPQSIQIKPRNLAVGIGCRRGVSYPEVRGAWVEVMDRFALEESCVKHLATIDIKTDEEAIRRLSQETGIPLLAFSADEIGTLDGSYEPSEWVKEKVGVGGVCEPAARLAAKQGQTIVPKQKIGAVTISVAMEKSWWWDWDLETENC